MVEHRGHHVAARDHAFAAAAGDVAARTYMVARLRPPNRSPISVW